MEPAISSARRPSNASNIAKIGYPTTRRMSNAPESFNYANICPVQHDMPGILPKRSSLFFSGHDSRQNGLGSARQSLDTVNGTIHAAPAIRDSSSPVELGLMLRFISRLVSACETKFTVELIERICASGMDKYRLTVNVGQFAQDLQRHIVETLDDLAKHKSGPISIFQSVFHEMDGQLGNVQGENGRSTVKSTKQEKRKTRNSQDDNLIRSAEFWDAIETASVSSLGSEKSKISQHSTKPPERPERLQTILSNNDNGGHHEFSKHSLADEDCCFPECSQDSAKFILPMQPSPVWGEETVSEQVNEGRFLRGVSAESKGKSPQRSKDISLDEADDVSESSDEDEDQSPRSLKSGASSVSEAHRIVASDHRYIDLDDVSLEQAQILATPSDRLIIHPNQRFRVAWDLLVLLLIICECITLPLSLSFAITLPQAYHIPSFAVFALDMVVSFTTGYYHKDLLIMKRRRITRNYLQTWFLLDFVSLFPWEETFFLFIGNNDDDRDRSGKKTMFLRILKLGKLMRVLRLLRVAKVTALIKQLQANGIISQNLMHLKFGMSVTKMFIVFGFLSHWLACLWGWVGSPATFGHSSEYDAAYVLDDCEYGGPCEPGIEGAPWLHRYGMDNYDKVTQYIAALHFTSALITGGDAPMGASYPIERLFTITVMFCSLLVTSSVVGEILLIINRQGEAKMAFDEQVQQAQDFMVARNVALSFQLKVFRYMETQFEIQHGTGSSSNRSFMHALSGPLQAELIQQLNGPLIMQHPFFAKLDNEEAVSYLSQEASPMIFAKSDHVVTKDEPATCAHWIVSGKVRIDSPLVFSGKVLYLKPPCWLGDVCLFADTLRKNTVTAVITTETLCLYKWVLQDACRKFPGVKASFDDFRQHVFKDKLESLVCPICHDIGHCEEQCPERRKGGGGGGGVVSSKSSMARRMIRTLSTEARS